MSTQTDQTVRNGGGQDAADRRFRLLVLTPAEVDGTALRGEVQRRHSGESVQVHVVSPAVTESPLKHAMGDVDDASRRAKSRLDEAVRELGAEGLRVSGRVGDSDPIIAAQDALAIFPADEILVVTHAEEDQEWFEEGLFERASERLEPPLSHAVVPRGDHADVREVERSGAGLPDDGDAADEVELSENLPPFSKLDLAGIVVAIVGTVVLAILAAEAGDHSNTAFAAARILIAIAFALINLAHVVGLVFFDSVRYRGPAQTLFRTLSLVGTPIAVAVSLLLGLLL